MRLEGIAGDASAQTMAYIYVGAEDAHVVVTIDPADGAQADVMLTPDQAIAISEALASEAKLARQIGEE